ncbi:MAG: hypothetical protein K0Q48_2519 [Bacillota bacterium]|jgi:DNA-binding ferritin-like protein (Dps family)|nr:hypothetical protein [Bacillota bacterium]
MNQLKKLRKENNKQDKLLSNESNTIMVDMVCYLRASNLCEYDIEVIRKELTGMALESQLRNQQFSEVIGEDYKAFCDELIKNGSSKTRYEKGLEISYVLVHGIMVLYLVEIVCSSAIVNIIQSGQFSMQITAGFVLSTLIALGMGFGIYYYMTKNSFELTKKNRKLQFVLIIGFAVVWTSVVLLRLVMKNTVLLTINCFYPIIVLAPAYLIITVLNHNYTNSFFKLGSKEE